MSRLTLTSSAFKEGDWIPKENSARGADRSPELFVDGICKDAVSMVVIMNDKDNPLFKNYNHWLIWNLPVMNRIPANIKRGRTVSNLDGAMQGIAYGWHCYKGPKPPLKSIHTYTFTIYILDCKLALPSICRRYNVVKAMKGHVLQEASLSGKFQSFRN